MDSVHANSHLLPQGGANAPLGFAKGAFSIHPGKVNSVPRDNFVIFGAQTAMQKSKLEFQQQL